MFLGRRFPGVVIQGDTLHALCCAVNEIAELARRTGDAELIESVGLLGEGLNVRLRFYEETLAKNGYSLPYSRPTR